MTEIPEGDYEKGYFIYFSNNFSNHYSRQKTIQRPLYSVPCY